MKRGNHSKSRSSKALVMILALVLIIGATAGATLAWFTDTTGPVVNTFTVGNVDITLGETKSDFKMIPGHTIDKDPLVTVVDGSEDCWLFVKLDEAILPAPSASPYAGTQTFRSYLTYEIADDWTPLDGHSGVYYRSVMKGDATKAFPVIKGDKVTVLPGVTKGMMDELTNANCNPTLTVTAYACQYYSTNDTPFAVDAAWHTIVGGEHTP